MNQHTLNLITDLWLTMTPQAKVRIITDLWQEQKPSNKNKELIDIFKDIEQKQILVKLKEATLELRAINKKNLY
jgi:hypothetical protein